jgi:hypothetical protein
MSSRRRAISSPSAVRVFSMNISDTLLLVLDLAVASTAVPTGSATRANLRVETPASMRSITARCNGSRSAKYSYVATGSSLPSTDRTRGRLTGTVRPPRVIDPAS